MEIAPQKQKALSGEPNEWLQRASVMEPLRLGKFK
jgi:hypothetical protein